jgi:hypothetical protein
MVILSESEMNGMTRAAFEQGAVPTSGRYRTQGMWATAPRRSARRIIVGKSILFECFEVPQRTR